MIKIILPDDSVREYESGVLLGEIAKDISEGLARVVLGAVVNDNIMGLQEPIRR